MEYKFNKKIFKNNYASIWIKGLRISYVGLFILLMIIICSMFDIGNGFFLKLPGFINYFIGFYCLFSIILFLFMASFKSAKYKSLKQSVLSFEEDTLSYTYLKEQMILAFGNLRSVICTVTMTKSDVTEIKQTKRYLIIYGKAKRVDKSYLNAKEQIEKEKEITKVKIPIAYSDLKSLYVSLTTILEKEEREENE